MIETKIYPELTENNIVDIIRRFLRANPVEQEGKIYSSNPSLIAGVHYAPCGFNYPPKDKDNEFPHLIHHELQELYRLNQDKKELFWNGMHQVLAGIKTEKNHPELGEYGLTGLFSTLEYIRARPTHHEISPQVKEWVDHKIFQKVSALEWDGEDDYQHQDVHPLVIKALAVAQENIPKEYWLEMLSKEPEYTKPAFRGLAFCNPAAAEKLIDTKEIKLDAADVQIICRAAKRFYVQNSLSLP